MDIDQEIDEMQTALDALRDKAEKQKKPIIIAGRYVSEPENNVKYWYIESNSTVYSTAVKDDGLLSGNCYETRKAAEHYLERAKVVQELWQCEGACEWHVNIFSIHFNANSDEWWSGSWDVINPVTDLPFFGTKAQTQAAIDKLGSRLDVLRGFGG